MMLRATTPVFVVSDIAATMQWYRANLGFAGRAVPDPPPHHFGILQRDDVEIMLQQRDGYVKPEIYHQREGGVWDVYVRMDGVREFAAALPPEVTVLVPLCEQPYGQIEIVVRDVNGYVLVFAEAV